MIHRTSKEQLAEYEASSAINQSRLKLLEKGVDAFNSATTETSAALFYEEKDYFIIGSAIDCKLTGEKGAFEEIYHVTDCPKPSDKIMSIVQMCFHELSQTLGGNPYPATLEDVLTFEGVPVGETMVWRAIEAHAYYTNRKPDTRVKGVVEEGQPYYKSLVDAVGKVVLSLDEFNLVKSIETSLMNHPLIKNLFTDRVDVDKYFQLPIYFTYQDIECKALLDILVVNHQNKTVRFSDLKTMFDYVVKFPYSVKSRRYDFQVAFYYQAVLAWMQQMGLTDYKLLNPAFIVETTKPGAQGKPLIFMCSDELMGIGMNGRSYFAAVMHKFPTEKKTYVETSKVLGINQAIELYKWHLDNGFEVDRVIAESETKEKGVVLLDWEGIR